MPTCSQRCARLVVAELPNVVCDTAFDTNDLLQKLEHRVTFIPSAHSHRLEYDRKARDFRLALTRCESACSAGTGAGSHDVSPLVELLALRTEIIYTIKDLCLINMPDPEEGKDPRRYRGLRPAQPPPYSLLAIDPPLYVTPFVPTKRSRRRRVRDWFLRPPQYELAKASERSYETTGWARLSSRRSRMYGLR